MPDSVDLSILQSMIQRVLDQQQTAATKDEIAGLREDMLLLRATTERGFDVVTQLLDGQMLRNQRQDERLDGLAEQVKGLGKRLDHMAGELTAVHQRLIQVEHAR